MQIIIVEKNTHGSSLLKQVLKMEGYEVLIADTGSHAIDLLKEGHSNIVLMNVFQCLLATPTTPERKLIVRQYEASKSVLLVTCDDDEQDGFTSVKSDDTAFDLMPTKAKSHIVERIQEMCYALRQRTRPPAGWEDSNRQRFGQPDAPLTNIPPFPATHSTPKHAFGSQKGKQHDNIANHS